MTPEEGERPAISGALKSYSDRVFANVPLREKHKHILRYEFETHLEDYSEELQDLGYKPYAAEDEIVRRVGPPEQVAENFNRMESLRNWLRDHLCTRAVMFVLAGYIALSAMVEFVTLLMGLSGLDTQIAYNLDAYMVDARRISALLAGPLAYWMYYRWSGNIHRLTPFATLSIGLFIAVSVIECNLNFISPFPNPECRIFLLADFPSLFFHIPFMARSYIVYEFGISGLSIEIFKDALHVLAPSYSPGGPKTLVGYSVGLILAGSFLIERFEQRQSFEPA